MQGQTLALSMPLSPWLTLDPEHKCWPPYPLSTNPEGRYRLPRLLNTLTKNIPIASSSLFGGDLGKAVVKSATASCNYKTLGDCFDLSDLSRPKPPPPSPEARSGRQMPCHPLMGKAGLGTARAAPPNQVQEEDMGI